MSSDRLERLQALFLDALEIPDNHREAWIAEHCGEDFQLADELRELLTEVERRQDPLEAGLNESAIKNQFTASANEEETPKLSSNADTSISSSTIFHVAKERLPQIEGYEIIDKIARGGMGVVYKARQISLNRIVALKLIRSGELADDEEIHRFRIEAEAAAQLDHPHVVPIYEVGEQNSQHFFSMGFVEGNGLDARLKEGPLPPREAAELIKTIAEAIQYAHEKGIVHRDLKPANVLIDVDGKPRITDFGLAKIIAGDSEMTATGRPMGTPSYMPPEQAAGNTKEIGPLSDVYSLGAMLYALLTGRPPYHAANVMETLKQVLKQEPVSPRVLNAAVDKDLETICLKTLEKEPAKRYASSDELAADLARFLDGKPILARPISKPARMWRWCRRNPLGATVVGLLVILAIAGPAIAVCQMEINRRLDEALAGETEQREKAEANEKAARESERKMGIALDGEKAALARKDKALQETEAAIDRYVQTVKDAKLLKDPQFKDLLKLLLKDALAHYERFVEEHKDEQDEKTRARLADAFYEIGVISYVRGSKQEAIKAFHQALQLNEPLAQENPTVAKFQVALSNTHNSLGVLYSDTGSLAKAMTAYQQALKIQQKLARENPMVADYQSNLAMFQNNIGLQYKKTGNLVEALKAHRQALTTLEKVAHENPTVAVYQSNLATYINNISDLYHKTGKPSEALTAIQQALKIRERLARENPKMTEYQHHLASSHGNLGVLLYQTGKPTEALTAYQKALKIQERLARENPAVTQYQSALASSHGKLGDLYRKTGKPTEALTAYQKSLKIWERLVRENPKVMEFQEALAKGHCGIGNLYGDTGKLAEALSAFQHAMEIYQQLLRDNSTLPQYQSSLASCHHNIGYTYNLMGKPTEALSAHQQALTIQEKLVRDKPTALEYQSDLAKSLNEIGRLNSDTGKMADAMEAYRHALRIRERLARENPTVTEYQKVLADSHFNIGLLYRQTGKPVEALKHMGLSLPIFVSLRKQNPHDASMRSRLLRSYGNRALAFDALGRHREAANDWRGALDVASGPNRLPYQLLLCLSLARSGGHIEATTLASQLLKTTRNASALFYLARTYAISANRASQDDSLGESQQRQAATRYAETAMAILKAVARSGFFKTITNQNRLRYDTDLNALRHRGDFRQLAKSVGIDLPAWALKPRSKSFIEQPATAKKPR